jgi:hypothetical protein
MRPDTLWQKELIEETKSIRTLSIKLLLSFILISPLAIVQVPPHISANGLAIAVIFLGVFGSSVGIVGWRDTKMLERLALLPYPPFRIISDYILANSFLEGLQLVLPFILILFSRHIDPVNILWVIVSLLAALVAANSLGVIIALISKSSGEVHLFAFLGVLLVSGLSGLLGGTNIWPLSTIGPIWPFWQLSNSLLFAWGLSDLQIPLLTIITGAMIYFASLFFAPRLFQF